MVGCDQLLVRLFKVRERNGKSASPLGFSFNFQTVAYPGFFFGGVSTNSVEDRENGDLGVVAP